MKKKITIILIIISIYSCSSTDNDSISQHNSKQNEITVSKVTKEESLFSISKIKTHKKAFQHRQKFTSDYNIYEPMGSGVAVIDINNDGVYEVFFAQFDQVTDQAQSASILYSIKDNEFSDITEQAGLDSLTSIWGATTADINNDGWTDMLIYGYKTIHMMINNNGRFEELLMPQLPSNSFYSSATFFNSNGDDYLDIWLSRYVNLESGKSVSCISSDGLPSYCTPSTYPFQSDFLLINREGKSFIQAGKEIINIPAAPALGVVAADFDNDNLQDIYVANDGQDNYLYIQQQDGSFINQADIKSADTNLSGIKEASMGIAVGDYDNNGLSDIFVSHYEKETNTLYKNNGDWFTDVTNRTGLSANSRSLTGFGTGFYDLNGDNWLDLVVLNGRIEPKAYQERGDFHEQFKEKPLLYINKEGMFEYDDEFNKPNILNQVGRGLSFVDIDNDGDKDMISNNNNATPLLLLNNNNPDEWYGLIIKCHNRIDIGARLQFTIKSKGDSKIFHRSVHTDGSYASANDPRITISVGKNDLLSSVSITYGNSNEIQKIAVFKKNIYIEYNCKR